MNEQKKSDEDFIRINIEKHKLRATFNASA